MRILFVACLTSALAIGCGETSAPKDETAAPAPTGSVVVEETTISLASDQVVRLGASTTLDLPAVPSREPITVRAVSGVVRRGATPAGDVVQVASRDVTFAPAARMRQTVPAPPVGRSYVAAYAPDTADAAWVMKSPAVAVAAATVALAEDVDGGALPGGVTYQIEVTGTGLWAIALADAGTMNMTTCQLPATGCMANQSCALGCRDAAPVFACQAAGTKKQGEPCSGFECEAGTQCMRTACGVSICNRLCRDDAACGSGGRCLTLPIVCGTANTDVRTCATACDPTGQATQGCLGGLKCLLFPNEIPSCDCPATSRTKGDGEACATGDDCQAGMLCVANSTTGGTGSLCRPICRIGGTDCAAPRTCIMVRNPDYKTWGACAPQ